MQEMRTSRTTVDPIDGEVVETRREQVVGAAPGEVVTTAHRPVVAAPAAASVDQVQATAYDPYAQRRQTSHRMVQAIWLLFGIVEGLLAIRFILKLLGANPEAGFASFIYAASGPFVAPFNNLFGNPASSGSVLELNTLVAIVVYMLLAWLIAKVVWLLAGESRAATTTVANSTRARLD